MTGLWLILHSAEPDAFINCRQPEGSWSGMTSAKIRADFSNFQSLVQHLGVCCKLLAWSSAMGVPQQLWGSRKVELCWTVLNLFLSLPYVLALNVHNTLTETLQDVVSLQEAKPGLSTKYLYAQAEILCRILILSDNLGGWGGCLIFMVLVLDCILFACLKMLPEVCWALKPHLKGGSGSREFSVVSI